MARLYRAIVLLTVVFAVGIALVCYGVWNGPWWISLVGVLVLGLFLGLGGLLMPPAQKSLHGDDVKEGAAALQMLGALILTLFLVGALVLWVSGNRTLSHNNLYQVLGLLIFGALLLVGAQGVLVTFVKWLFVRNQRTMAGRQALAASDDHPHTALA